MVDSAGSQFDNLPTMTATKSSNISEYGYDEVRRSLYLRFHNGMIYKFFQIPEGIWKSFVGASSKGKFFSGRIRGNFRYMMSGRKGWRKHGKSVRKKKK